MSLVLNNDAYARAYPRYDGINKKLSGTYGFPLTIAMWIKPPDVSATSGIWVQMGANSATDPSSVRIAQGGVADQLFVEGFDGAGGALGASASSIESANYFDDRWVPVVTTFTGSSTTNSGRHLYYDSYSKHFSDTTPDTVGGAFGYLCIADALGRGLSPGALGTGYKCAHVTIWDSVLSPVDIEAFMAGTNPATIAHDDIIVYYALTADESQTDGYDLAGPLTLDEATIDTGDNPTTAAKYLKLLAHSSAASAASVEGVVLNAARDTVIGEFTEQTFEASLEGGEAVLLVPAEDIRPGGGNLVVGTSVYVSAQNSTYGTVGSVAATIVSG